MPSVHRQALVALSPDKLYALVEDVEAYPDFLPWCRSAVVLSRDVDEVRATVTLAKGAVEKSFTTCNRLQHNKMIEMRLVEGPFRCLEGFWRFDALDEGAATKVSLDLEFEFSNRLVALAVGPVFNQIANSLVDAFVARARELYA
jgi:ribosome-associated toxin RatA of RatAB toxin-antitoxin module